MADREVIRAFSADHVVRLTGLSAGQLRTWDNAGFFKPHYAYENRRTPYSRIYSFRDVVGLRTVAVLMKDYRVTLRHLKDTADRLAKKGYEHWADVKLFVVNGQVHFRNPGTDEVEGLKDGQLAMLSIIDVITDVEKRVVELQRRSTFQHGRVEHHKYVARNADVVAGTRIPTAAIRRYSEAGYSPEDILKEYPTLTKADVEGALVHEKRVA
jgi:uncharacterized protein (DUF433 family)